MSQVGLSHKLYRWIICQLSSLFK